MASSTIDQSFYSKFNSALTLNYSLRGGIFSDKVVHTTTGGEEEYFDQLGDIFAQEKVARNSESPENDMLHDKRRCIATPYNVGFSLDKMDKVQQLINPESSYTKRLTQAIRRKHDIEDMKGILGTAYSGKGGLIANNLGAGNVIANANTGMTLEKLMDAKMMLELADIDLDDPENKMYFAWTPKQARELLNDPRCSSTDTAQLKALVTGQISSFYGFEFITSNMIPFADDSTSYGVNLNWDDKDRPIDADGNDIRACFAYVKSNIKAISNPEINSWITQRDDKCRDWYAYCETRRGAVRMNDDGVIIVGCDETVD